MGFRRLVSRHGAELRHHRKIKQCSSCAVGVLLLAVVCIVCAYEGLGLKHPANAAMVAPIDLSLGHRRLVCEAQADAYPDDPLIPRRGNPPSYFNATVAERSAIVVHIILVVYMLLGLNTICDIYFCGALDVMVDAWGIKPDVAGATFMAAGGSAPELFTSLIGAVITENDVGFSTIVGSAVFNVLAVIGACGVCTQEPISLTWWPLFRDCTCYIIGLSLLACFSYGEAATNSCGERIGGGGIALWEACLLFAAYIGYCVLMYFNEQLEANVKSFLARHQKQILPEESADPAPAGDDEEVQVLSDDEEIQVLSVADPESQTEVMLWSTASDDDGALRERALGSDAPTTPLVLHIVREQPPAAPPELTLNAIPSIEEVTLPAQGMALPSMFRAPPKAEATIPLQTQALNVPVGSSPSCSPRTRVTGSLNLAGSELGGRGGSLRQAGLLRHSFTAGAPETQNVEDSECTFGPRGSKGNRRSVHLAHHIRVVHHKAAGHLKKDQVGVLIRSCSTRQSIRHGNWTPTLEVQEIGKALSPKPSPRLSPRPPDCKEEILDISDYEVEEPQDEPAPCGEEDLIADDTSSVESDDVGALMVMPDDLQEKILWILALPIYVPLYYCLPRPTQRLFMATFFLSLIWIAGFSFVLVYCVELFGEAILGGGDNVTVVMSFTVLAAGTSIPDLVSSMAVAKAGEGDMAVSSSIGSNIFDILVGLPVPWIIKIALVERNVSHTVQIRSPYIALYVLLLLFMVFCVITSIHFMGWKLSKPLGYSMAGLYVVFLGVVLPVEFFNKGPYL